MLIMVEKELKEKAQVVSIKSFGENLILG